MCPKGRFGSAWSPLPEVLLLPGPVVSPDNSHFRRSQTQEHPATRLKEAEGLGTRGRHLLSFLLSEEFLKDLLKPLNSCPLSS